MSSIFKNIFIHLVNTVYAKLLGAYVYDKRPLLLVFFSIIQFYRSWFHFPLDGSHSSTNNFYFQFLALRNWLRVSRTKILMFIRPCIIQYSFWRCMKYYFELLTVAIFLVTTCNYEYICAKFQSSDFLQLACVIRRKTSFIFIVQYCICFHDMHVLWIVRTRSS